jgi:hypothetical protein
MTNFSKHLPYYVILLGCLCLSVGYNVVQNQEIKILNDEKKIYELFFEYLRLKIETIESLKNNNLVYNKISGE